MNMTRTSLEEWQKNCLGCIYFDEEARTKDDTSCTNFNEKETDATEKVCLSFVLKQNHKNAKIAD